MGAASSEAERLRLCRLAFERAMRDGTLPAEARKTMARETHRQATERLAAKCGTQAPRETGDQPAFWWRRDDL